MGGSKIGLGVAAMLLLAGCVAYPGGYYGGSTGPWQHAGGGPVRPGGGHGGFHGAGGTLRCESNDDRIRRCAANTRGGVTLTRQLSRTRCVQGRNWGWDNRGVWVSHGCRAEFVAGRGGGLGGPSFPGGGFGQTLRCESRDNRHRRCNVQVRSSVDLVRQLSDRRCVRGQNWGWDRSGIWVDGGCRAEFRVR